MHAAYLALNRKKTDEYTAAIEFFDNVLERDLKRVLLAIARRRYSGDADRTGPVRRRRDRSARGFERSNAFWRRLARGLRGATAAELGLRDLRNDIEPLARKAGADVVRLPDPLWPRSHKEYLEHSWRN